MAGMIVYGWRSSVLGTEPIHHTCSACNGDTMTFVAYQRYAHIYWIPLFPLNKLVFLKCPTCKHAVERKDMSMEEKAAISSQLAKTRTPVWTFSALALIAVLSSGVLYAEHLTT